MPVLWTVYGAAYNGSGSRLVYVRTAKRLSILSMNSSGEVWQVAPYARPSDYWSIYERDLARALNEFKRHPKERPRWLQLPLPLEFPEPKPENIIQLFFAFPERIAA